MAEDKKYSLISVDVAPDEEVLHVDASGVHEQAAVQGASAAASADADQGQGSSVAAGTGSAGAYAAASSQQADASPAGNVAPATGETAGQAAGKAVSPRPDSSDSYQATEKDLEGPVPMAGLQKAIIAVVVVCLVGFAAYFGFTH